MLESEFLIDSESPGFTEIIDFSTFCHVLVVYVCAFSYL